jgi:hypothetical protein
VCLWEAGGLDLPYGNQRITADEDSLSLAVMYTPIRPLPQHGGRQAGLFADPRGQG